MSQAVTSKTQRAGVQAGYNYGYLDEQTKRMIRRAILKAVAIPGYQVPFGGREMPMPYGWGTGGIQITAAIIGQDDVLKVIDQARMTPLMQYPFGNSLKRLQMPKLQKKRQRRP